MIHIAKPSWTGNPMTIFQSKICRGWAGIKKPATQLLKCVWRAIIHLWPTRNRGRLSILEPINENTLHWPLLRVRLKHSCKRSFWSSNGNLIRWKGSWRNKSKRNRSQKENLKWDDPSSAREVSVSTASRLKNLPWTKISPAIAFPIRKPSWPRFKSLLQNQ